MPREHTVTLYQYSELSEEAQEKAREWWRELEAQSGDLFWSDSVTDDFKTVAKACGFELDAKHPVSWSGFYSQGDGAAFTGSWASERVDIAATLADRPATYTDDDGKVQPCEGNAELAVILQAFASLAAERPTSYGSAEASHRGYNMATDWDCAEGGDTLTAQQHTDCANQFEELCRDLAHYFYRSLEREYEYANSDEQVAETLIANEYEFTIDGRHA